jgi:hypothetical protein
MQSVRTVWRGCDGHNRIEFLSRELQKEYKLGRASPNFRCSSFFKDLGRRGYVGFVTDRLKSRLKNKLTAGKSG